MTVSVEVVDPRVDPEPSDWAGFEQEQDLYPVWDYHLQHIEAWMSRNPAVLLVVRERGRIVGSASGMVCEPQRSPAYAGSPRGRAGRVRPRWVQMFHPCVGDHGVVVDGGLDPAARRDVVRQLERALRSHLGTGLVGIVYRNVADVSAYDGAGRLVREVRPPAAVLANRWRSDQEWLADLSRNRRKNVRRIDRLVATEPSLIVRGGSARDDLDGAELAAMLRTHRAKFGRQRFDPRTPVAAAYLDALVRRDDVHTLTYSEPRGRLLAFSTILDHPVAPLLQFWAARADDGGGRRHLYFDCHARAVRFAIRAGRRELVAGRGMFAEKRSLGFGARRMSVVVVPRPVVGR